MGRQIHNHVLGKYCFVCSSCPDLHSAQRMAGFQALSTFILGCNPFSISPLKVIPIDLHVGVITLPLSGKCTYELLHTGLRLLCLLQAQTYSCLEEKVKCIWGCLDCFSLNLYFRVLRGKMLWDDSSLATRPVSAYNSKSLFSGGNGNIIFFFVNKLFTVQSTDSFPSPFHHWVTGIPVECVGKQPVLRLLGPGNKVCVLKEVLSVILEH